MFFCIYDELRFVFQIPNLLDTKKYLNSKFFFLYYVWVNDEET